MKYLCDYLEDYDDLCIKARCLLYATEDLDYTEALDNLKDEFVKIKGMAEQMIKIVQGLEEVDEGD